MAYNTSITIQQATESRDTYGEVDTTWATYKTVWSEMTNPGGSLSYESDMRVYSDLRTFKFRTQDAPDVTTKMRVYDGTDYFWIRSIQKDNRMFTILTASAYDDE